MASNWSCRYDVSTNLIDRVVLTDIVNWWEGLLIEGEAFLVLFYLDARQDSVSGCAYV